MPEIGLPGSEGGATLTVVPTPINAAIRYSLALSTFRHQFLRTEPVKYYSTEILRGFTLSAFGSVRVRRPWSIRAVIFEVSIAGSSS